MSERRYQIIAGKRPCGPFTAAELRTLRDTKRLPGDAHYCGDDGKWRPVAEILQVKAEPKMEPAPEPKAPEPEPVAARQLVKPQRSRGIFLGLAFFGGAIGLHNFYIGNAGRAFGQIALSILAAMLPRGMGMILVFLTLAIWVIGEMIFTSTDADGDPLRS